MDSLRPSWVADAVLYQVFPDRFARSDRVDPGVQLEDWTSPPTVHGFKGGDLYGLSERLDWIRSLGANTLYLNPIFQSAANHRYHTHDYLRVDPLLGGDEAFDTLLSAAHAKGIRIILDGVFNHASRSFFPFADLLENGPDSPWRDWFIVHRWPLRAYGIQKATTYEAWWDLPALPKLNTDHPPVREFLYQVAEYWTRKGIDGWRLDVPTEIRTPGFWEEFRERVRACNPDAWVVGGIWDDASEWVDRGNRFDGAMNYPLTEQVLRFVIGKRLDSSLVEKVGYDLRPTTDADEFCRALGELHNRMPPDVQVSNLNLVGSHDTPRIRTLCNDDADLARLAHLLLFCLPGAPSIYYGDELGLEGAHDPDCRGTMPWDAEASWDQEFLDDLRALVALRKASPALRGTEIGYVPAGPDHPRACALVRAHGPDRRVVAVNAGDEPARIEIHAAESGEQIDRRLWGRGELQVTDGKARVGLPPKSGSIWA